jgi:hypothetical protein
MIGCLLSNLNHYPVLVICQNDLIDQADLFGMHAGFGGMIE